MKIVDVSATPLFIPYRKSFNWAQGVTEGASVVLVEIATDDGIVGYGESIATPSARGLLLYLEEVARLIEGEDPFLNARLIEEIYRSMFRERGTCSSPRFASQLIAGVELALWDIMGKATSRPVYELLGGSLRDEISYFGFPQGDTADEVAAEAADYAAAGHEVIYVKVGRGDELDLSIVEKTREAIGAGRRLRVDANEQWDGLRAYRMLKMLEPYDIEFVEQPTNAEATQALDRLARSSATSIAADQSVFSPFDVYNLCRDGNIRLIVLGIHESGGMRRFAEMSHIAAAAGIDVCIHGLYESGITTCASYAVASTVKNLDDGNQYMNDLLEWDIIASPSLTLRNGRLGPIPGAGLGFELDWDNVERAAELHRARETSPT